MSTKVLITKTEQGLYKVLEGLKAVIAVWGAYLVWGPYETPVLIPHGDFVRLPAKSRPTFRYETQGSRELIGAARRLDH